jgi:methylenetetrahydrofolate reductase (NADPH)
MTRIDVSFEFFPADTPAGAARLLESVEQLSPLAPAFMSVTYGAGGSTRDRTIDTIDDLRAVTCAPIAGHLTCVGASRAETHEVIDRYQASGVRHIIALRGDAPTSNASASSRGPAPYEDAAALVRAIRDHVNDADFEISVAAYPEVHPKARSRQSDLDNLKRKLDAGATRAISQFFFDPDLFLRFLDEALSAGVTAPIVPGIMPITHFGRITNFSKRCGASIPQWMNDLFSGLDDRPDVRSHIAAIVAAEQCRRLADHGIRSFHFYTMNRAALSAATCRILGIGQVDRSKAELQGAAS